MLDAEELPGDPGRPDPSRPYSSWGHPSASATIQTSRAPADISTPACVSAAPRPAPRREAVTEAPGTPPPCRRLGRPARSRPARRSRRLQVRANPRPGRGARPDRREARRVPAREVFLVPLCAQGPHGLPCDRLDPRAGARWPRPLVEAHPHEQHAEPSCCLELGPHPSRGGLVLDVHTAARAIRERPSGERHQARPIASSPRSALTVLYRSRSG